MPGACQNENPQTVPFQMGQFFGPTADFIVPEDNNIEAPQNTNTDGGKILILRSNFSFLYFDFKIYILYIYIFFLFQIPTLSL